MFYARIITKRVKPSLKAKYCPRVSCRQKTHKTHVILTFDRAKFRQAKCSG